MTNATSITTWQGWVGITMAVCILLPMTFAFLMRGVRRNHTPIHVRSRSQDNRKYPQRQVVPDELVPWVTWFPAYSPKSWTHESVCPPEGNSPVWADPPYLSVFSLMYRVVTHRLFLDCSGTWPAPRNPVGRTGLRGRGFLGKYGPNFAGDALVTRCHPLTNELQMVGIERGDTGQWAILGGMVDKGEIVSKTVKREFVEEGGNLSDPDEQKIFNDIVEELFSSGVLIYDGYVDDPRNTDNAWMVTTVYHFHCTKEQGRNLVLRGNKAEGKVTWISPDQVNYASHGTYAQMAVSRLTNVM